MHLLANTGSEYHHAAIRRLLTRFLFAGGLDVNYARLCCAQGDKTPDKIVLAFLNKQRVFFAPFPCCRDLAHVIEHLAGINQRISGYVYSVFTVSYAITVHRQEGVYKFRVSLGMLCSSHNRYLV